MSRSVFYSLFATALIMSLAACSSSTKETAEETVKAVEEEVQEITISKLEGSPEYGESTLALVEPAAGSTLDTGAVAFSFDVQNYELGAQTEGAGANGLANSGKGQHIHFIVDNDPYSAHYEASFEKSFEPGNHVVLAFLSRSYHESVKNPNAFVVSQFTVGDTDEPQADLSGEHLFYSRPKGTYSGADTEKLMLDFYLVNTSISADGNKVRATINGTEFLIDEWAPYVIEGLPLGEVTVKLELIDASGNAVPGPFNTVERTVTLEE